MLQVIIIEREAKTDPLRPNGEHIHPNTNVIANVGFLSYNFVSFSHFSHQYLPTKKSFKTGFFFNELDTLTAVDNCYYILLSFFSYDVCIAMLVELAWLKR